MENSIDRSSSRSASRLLKTIRIENYKSIESLVLPLGRVNVFIGENGAGKSNILEAIALAGAAQARKLDNEFLASRGIRVSGPELMRSAFRARKTREPIVVSVEITGGPAFSFALTNDNKPYSTWHNSSTVSGPGTAEEAIGLIQEVLSSIDDEAERSIVAERIRKELLQAIENASNSTTSAKTSKISVKLDLPEPQKTSRALESGEPIKPDRGGIEDFIIYAPENSTLRLFDREGQVEPLGINGEGLLKLLSVLSRSRNRVAINELTNPLIFT